MEHNVKFGATERKLKRFKVTLVRFCFHFKYQFAFNYYKNTKKRLSFLFYLIKKPLKSYF